jgi:hypothetical protein
MGKEGTTFQSSSDLFRFEMSSSFGNVSAGNLLSIWVVRFYANYSSLLTAPNNAAYIEVRIHFKKKFASTMMGVL